MIGAMEQVVRVIQGLSNTKATAGKTLSNSVKREAEGRIARAADRNATDRIATDEQESDKEQKITHLQSKMPDLGRVLVAEERVAVHLSQVQSNCRHGR